MVTLDLLWLPILLSSVFVFLASAYVNMGSPWRKNDFPRHPQQDDILKALRPFDLAPGEYLFPRPKNRKEMSEPEYQENLRSGPVFILTTWKYDAKKFGLTFLYWFLNIVLNGIFVAYIAGRALPAGAEYLEVFRFSGTAAFLAYVVALWQLSIWYNRPWLSAAKSTLDGLIYAGITAGTFGWLWPAL